jgi:hypothetical protein
MPVLIDPKRQFKAARRELGVSPMRRLLRQIAAHDVKLSHRDALEVFGHTGEFHTLDYASRVRSLEIWGRDALSWSNPVCYLALGLVR